MATPQFTALVLAGSRTKSVVGQVPTSKAALPLRGVPMIRRVVENLSQSAHVRDIVVCGPAHLAQWTSVPVVPTGGSPAGSVAAFLERVESPWPVLVTTADHPLLTTAMIDHFCARTLENLTDITVGMASRKLVMDAYPGSRRTAYGFRDDAWCSCNIFGMNTPRIVEVVRFWQSLEAHRKNPLRIVRAFGLRNLVNVLLGRYTLTQAFDAGAARLGITARAIEMPWPEAAIDVDTLDDLVLVDQIIAGRERQALRPAE
ncbi:MAG: nucleotidyltransferase family protein [Rhodospirillaceae bacterium]|nr:nucleotidyltransferase family protein [Rhodospirillaceae bacterium]